MSKQPLRVVGLFTVLLIVPNPGIAWAQSVTPISYTLRFPDPQTHYLEVEAVVPTDGRDQLELMMAVWTPGSYLVREYARHLEELTAQTPTGAPLSLESTRKNRWSVDTRGSPAVVVSYRVYSREMSVRTNWVGHDFALINGAPTFLTLADAVPRPHDVTIELPSHWARSTTALPGTPDGRSDSYRAADFDTLLDSPIVVGNPTIYEFTVDGTPHFLVNIGESKVWDGPRAAADVQRIVEEQRRMWGFFPYDRYLFFNLITEARGGIEHKNSTVLMTSRWQMRDRERYLSWLTLVSHELFHAWNVKRLRPVELGPFDYEREVQTRSLWVAEGLTVYYGALVVHRAGLSSREEYLNELSDEIRQLQTTPGRLVQSVEQASYDAWIKYYRPDENSANTTVSYYTKGAVIGFLLDAKLRHVSGGARSLDDAMQLAYERFSNERGFTPAEFRATVEDAASNDVDFDAWFVQVLETVAELDYSESLDWFGLNLSADGVAENEFDNAEAEAVPAWLGLEMRADGGRLVVSEVPRATPGFTAGFSVGDEILAIDDYRVRANGWAQRLLSYAAGDEVSVLIARRDELKRLDVTFGSVQEPTWQLDLRRVQTTAQPHRIDAWLGPVR
jgi:predicted metalloprotease with PDZ domain